MTLTHVSLLLTGIIAILALYSGSSRRKGGPLLGLNRIGFTMLVLLLVSTAIGWRATAASKESAVKSDRRATETLAELKNLRVELADEKARRSREREYGEWRGTLQVMRDRLTDTWSEIAERMASSSDTMQTSLRNSPVQAAKAVMDLLEHAGVVATATHLALAEGNSSVADEFKTVVVTRIGQLKRNIGLPSLPNVKNAEVAYDSLQTVARRAKGCVDQGLLEALHREEADFERDPEHWNPSPRKEFLLGRR